MQRAIQSAAWLRRAQSYGLRKRLADHVERRAASQLCSGRREHITRVKGGRGLRVDGERDHPRIERKERRRQHAVVGPHEIPPFAAHRDRLAQRTDAGIDDHEMHGTHREATPVARDRKAGERHILCRYVVREVEQRNTGRQRGEDALHLGDVAVGGAEVGE